MKHSVTVVYAAHLQDDPLLAAVADRWPDADWRAAHNLSEAPAAGLSALERPPVLGVLPLGTANDFALGAQIEVAMLRAQLAAMLDWPVRRVDLGRVNAHTFLNSLSLGMGAQATQQAPRLLKRLLGGAAYAVSGMATAMAWPTWPVRITCDDSEWEGEAVHIVVANGRYAGGGFEVAPRARLDDGLLDVAIYSASQAEALTEHMPRLIDGVTPGEAAQAGWRTAHCTIAAEPALPVSIDSEPESWDTLEISVLPRRLPLLLTPAASPLFTVRA